MIMKYTVLMLVFFGFMTCGFAQSIDFDLASPQPILNETYGGSILSGDLDNDGDIDVVQSGIGANTAVFLNDGEGNFDLQEQNFMNYWSTEGLVLADFDDDDHLDIIITGLNRTDLYRNDGEAHFILDEVNALLPSFSGSLIAGDVDGDGDNDVIQFGKSGSESSDPYFASLYLNDGTGNFIQDVNQTFDPFKFINLHFIDLEGDGDLDVISFGSDENNVPQVAVYKNDGSGNYSIFSNSNIDAQTADEISVGDIDNDGDPDVLILGLGENFEPKTRLLINDGSGQFTALLNTPFPDLFSGSNAFADLDDDNDLDIVLIGSQMGGLPNINAYVFENLGDNTFVFADSLVGEYIARNTIADFNGDAKNDIIIQGIVDDTNVYWNITSTCLGDFDNDGFINAADLLVFLSDFGCQEFCIADLNTDNVVNAADMLFFLGLFSSECP